jgi:hypothetical protein
LNRQVTGETTETGYHDTFGEAVGDGLDRAP